MNDIILHITPGDVCYGKFSILEVDEFFIETSSLTLIAGPNGSGKTSFFRSIIGIKANYTSRILFNNRCINETPPFQRSLDGIKYVPQDRRVFNRLTIRDHAILNRISFHRSSSTQYKNIVEKIVFAFKDLNRLGMTLSGGQAKLLLLLTLTHDYPKLILLDEPFAGLDSVFRTILLDIINQGMLRKSALIITDHTGFCENELKIDKLIRSIPNDEELNSSNPAYKLKEV